MTSIYFIDIYGLKGANIAYFITFMLHYTIVLIVFSKSLFGTLPQENI
jgi:PST family polysaccharide transporter